MSSPPLLDKRLQNRYQQLVQEHLNATTTVAAGLRALPSLSQAFASTQAAWRFYANDEVTLVQLAQPLLEHARAGITNACEDFALVVQDWSQLHYNDHAGKRHRVPLSQKTDLGYELHSGLLVSDRDGQPLAPVFQGLRAADGWHCSWSAHAEATFSPVDDLAPVMAFISGLGWAKTAVHVIDREADSVAHYRHWHQQGYLFLVRANERRKVQHAGLETSLRAVQESLKGAFRYSRDVDFHGKKVTQWVAETTVLLTRPAKLQRQGKKGPRTIVKGPVLSLRLIVAEVRDTQGKVLARWLLLNNLPETVTAERIALWYYWRWRIESFFKLLKKAGLHAEEWQQETPSAIGKRLLVAGMALVLVWQLAASKDPEADTVRTFLVRLSGRQMKRGKDFTVPALLAGLWAYLAMLYTLNHTDFQSIKEALERILAPPRSPPVV